MSLLFDPTAAWTLQVKAILTCKHRTVRCKHPYIWKRRWAFLQNQTSLTQPFSRRSNHTDHLTRTTIYCIFQSGTRASNRFPAISHRISSHVTWYITFLMHNRASTGSWWGNLFFPLHVRDYWTATSPSCRTRWICRDNWAATTKLNPSCKPTTWEHHSDLPHSLRNKR